MNFGKSVTATMTLCISLKSTYNRFLKITFYTVCNSSKQIKTSSWGLNQKVEILKLLILQKKKKKKDKSQSCLYECELCWFQIFSHFLLERGLGWSWLITERWPEMRSCEEKNGSNLFSQPYTTVQASQHFSIYDDSYSNLACNRIHRPFIKGRFSSKYYVWDSVSTLVSFLQITTC